MRRLYVLAAVLVLVVTACKIETNFGATINADGTGTLIFEIGVDDEAAQFFLDGSDPFADNEMADEPGARTREERRGDLTFYIVEVDVEDVTEMQDGLVGADNGVLNDLTITVNDDRVTVSGSASAADATGDAEDLDLDVPLDEIFSATVYFTMPGAITSHNADRQDGNTLYWDVPVLGGSLDIQAESDPTGTPASGGGGDGFPVWAIAILAVAVLGAVWYFMKGRSGGSAGGDTAPPAPVVDDAPPAPAPPTDE